MSTNPPQERPVRSGFARADDGIRLHWTAVGEGPVLACCNGVGVGTFFWKYFERYFSADHTVLLWDYRGHGRSGRNLDPLEADMTVERHARDMIEVLDDARACGVDSRPVVAVGHSMGCQVALEYYARRPDDVCGLVLALGTAGRALDTFFDWSRSPLLFAAAHRAIFRAGDGVNQGIRPVLESPLAWLVAKKAALVDPYYTSREDLVPYLAHLATLDFRLFIENVCRLNDHDQWPLLPDIKVPTLVIAAENDKFTPMWCSRKMVRSTPGAELLVLADASHAALIEQPETINHRVERFIHERIEHPADGSARQVALTASRPAGP